MRIPKLLRALALLLMTASFTGCLSYFDADELEIEPWETTVALPIMASSITMADFTADADTAFVNTQSDGLIEFMYNDTLISYRIADLIDIPDFSISESANFPLPTVTDVTIDESVSMNTVLGGSVPSGVPILPFSGIDYTMDFPSLTGFEVLSFSSGTISIRINNGLAAPLSFTLRLFDQNQNQSIGQAVFDIPANGTQVRNISLAGKSITNDLEARIFNMSSTGSSNTFNGDETLGFLVSFNNTVVEELTFTPTEDITYTESFNLNLPMPFDIEGYDISFLDGDVDYSITSSLGLDMSMRVTLPSSDKDGSPLSIAFDVTNGNGSGSVSLTGSSIDLTRRSPGYNILPVNAVIRIPASGNSITLRQNNSINIEAGMKNMAFDELSAYLGNQTIDLETDSLDVTVFDNTLSSVDLELDLVDPELLFLVENEYGVPFSFSFTNTRVERNNGSSALPILFSENPVSITEGSLGNPITTAFAVDNISEIFSFRPDVVHYGAAVQLNPGGKATNHITSEQTVTIKTQVTVPLHGKLSLKAISDPISADLSADGTLENIASMTFHIEMDNGFPVEIAPQFYLYGENGQLLDSLFSDGRIIFQAANVDSEGLVSSSVTSAIDVEISGERLNNLPLTRDIVLDMAVITSNDGAQNIKILDNYTVKASLGAVATIKINP